MALRLPPSAIPISPKTPPAGTVAARRGACRLGVVDDVDEPPGDDEEVVGAGALPRDRGTRRVPSRHEVPHDRRAVELGEPREERVLGQLGLGHRRRDSGALEEGGLAGLDGEVGRARAAERRGEGGAVGHGAEARETHVDRGGAQRRHELDEEDVAARVDP